ncbi:phosphopantetheine-binding protein [Streptomyces sp. SCSIO ZS0520]|uniref:phosphopantetheine-binding protein n=1 Tax=Streptomyces sp. SCSIO ZS0520 TaxID=2892996 RepID=UPI0021DA172A|nr:phosphopantetheine-binding protein [Streptomyces sp. SCSIO ZS0520]
MNPTTAATGQTLDPVDSWELAVLDAWHPLLLTEHLTRGTDFFEAGGTSVAAAQVMSRLRRSLAQQYPLSLLMENPVFADFVRAVRGGAARSVPLVRLSATQAPPAGTAPGSAWIHAAGGEVMFLHALAALVPYAHFLGVRDTDWDLSPYAPLVPQEFTARAAHHHALLAPEGVTHIAGYSSGAFAAHETVLLRLRAGLPTAPALLVDPPALHPAVSSPSYAQVLARRLGIAPEVAEAPQAHPERWRAALARRSPVGALPEESYEDWLTQLCRISAKGEWALCRYRPGPSPVRHRLVLSKSRPDLAQTVADWSAVCGRPPLVLTVDASHDEIIADEALAHAVADWLGEPADGSRDRA